MAAAAAAASSSINDFYANTYKPKAYIKWDEDFLTSHQIEPAVLSGEHVDAGIYLKRSNNASTSNLQLHIYVFDGTIDEDGNSIYWHIKIANHTRKKSTEFVTTKLSYEPAKNDKYNIFYQLPWNLTTLYLNVPFSFAILYKIHKSDLNPLLFDKEFLETKLQNIKAGNKYHGNPMNRSIPFFLQERQTYNHCLRGDAKLFDSKYKHRLLDSKGNEYSSITEEIASADVIVTEEAYRLDQQDSSDEEFNPDKILAQYGDSGLTPTRDSANTSLTKDTATPIGNDAIGLLHELGMRLGLITTENSQNSEESIFFNIPDEELTKDERSEREMAKVQRHYTLVKFKNASR